jgi:hypothetical protein
MHTTLRAANKIHNYHVQGATVVSSSGYHFRLLFEVTKTVTESTKAMHGDTCL